MLSPVPDFTKISPALYKTRHKFSCQLEDMVDSLRDKLEQLRSKKRRIEMRLKLEESAYKKPTHKVVEWLYKADAIGAEADRVIVEAEVELAERRTICCSPWNRRSSSIMGSSVHEKLIAVNQMLTVDDFDVVVQRTPHPHVDVIYVEPTVDFESGLDDVWRCLDDERLKIIGIFGMGGVGKTTLLKKIGDDLEKRRTDGPAVIWLSVSKETRLDAIKKDIAKQLTVFQKNANNRAPGGTRKYVLLIDGLWARLDLSKIEVPHLISTSYKVVFTTRSEAVSDDMAADAKLKLNCLPDDEAQKLFWMNAGGGIRDSFPQAQQLVSFCQGLPLALVSVGCAISGTRNPSLEEFSGLKHVFHVLQPSYDNLDDNMVRRLFLYCSILPGEIRKDELIRLWIGESFVDISDKRRGEYFVRKLEQACLLESEKVNGTLSMHSVIRAFSVYLCRELVEADKNILVQKWETENLNEAVRISIDGELDVTMLPPCSELRTLFIRNNNLTTIPVEFFIPLHALEVLNLSNNGHLAELPSSIGILINLHYLSLSSTSIKELPVEVKHLTELKVLLADYTENLKMIPRGLLRSLPSLKVFSKLGKLIHDDNMLLEELESSEGMDEVNISLFSHEAVTKSLDSQKLQNCIRKLTLKRLRSLKIPISSLSRMVHLENLVIHDCFGLQFEMDESRYHVLSIQGLWIRNCWMIDNLRWLIFTPRLQVLDLRSCESLIEVIGSDFELVEITEIDQRLGIFSNLKRIHLEDLNSLRCICPQVLPFPSLCDVYIINCPQLNVLPFDANHVLDKTDGRFLHLNDATEQRGGLIHERANIVRSGERPSQEDLQSQGETLTAPERGGRTNVTADSFFNQAWNLITDNHARSIAILGPGGVGKTTLMRRIHTKLITTPNSFHHVIWVTVSSNCILEKVQDDISKSVGCFVPWWVKLSFDQKAIRLRDHLARSKFALFLDDFNEGGVDFEALGVPYGTTLSKLIFTTRSRAVASRIKSTILELKMLSFEDSWKLFWNKVGFDRMHTEYADQSYIDQIARILVNESRGLPLLLCTVGRAMSSRVNHKQWLEALDQIQKMEGTDNEVNVLLQFCLDSLPNNTVKSCLTYFSLFPEDFTILKNELIDFGMCEHLFSDLNLGYSAIDTIIGASLLEEEEEGYSVKLLDMVRDFALSVVFKSQMFSNAQLLDSTDRDKLATVGWISPMKNSIRDLANLPQNLLTFLLNHNPFVMIKGEFSQFKDALTVLDLSKSGVEEVPREISVLVSLQYLNLSRTWIGRLPVELNALKKLKCLNLEHNNQLREIPRQVISGLPSLQILKMFRCGYSVEEVEDNILSVVAMDIEPLLQLKHIKVFSMTITCDSALNKFFSNPKLLDCTQSLSLEVFWGKKCVDISPLVDKNLLILEIRQAENLEEFRWDLKGLDVLRGRTFEGLAEVTVENCPSLAELTWVILAPNLKVIKVKNCDKMEEIINNGKVGEILEDGRDLEVFVKLEVLALEGLPILRSVYKMGEMETALPFRYLKKVQIFDCPILRKLPLNSNSAKGNDIVIEAEQEWWTSIWDDDSTKAAFAPYFKPCI